MSYLSNIDLQEMHVYFIHEEFYQINKFLAPKL